MGRSLALHFPLFFLVAPQLLIPTLDNVFEASLVLKSPSVGHDQGDHCLLKLVDNSIRPVNILLQSDAHGLGLGHSVHPVVVLDIVQWVNLQYLVSSLYV